MHPRVSSKFLVFTIFQVPSMFHIPLRHELIIMQHFCTVVLYMKIPRPQIVGGPCDYTAQGSKQTIHYLIWYNCRVTARLLFVSEVLFLIQVLNKLYYQYHQNVSIKQWL